MRLACSDHPVWAGLTWTEPEAFQGHRRRYPDYGGTRHWYNRHMFPYAFVRPLLFGLDAETAHDLTIAGLRRFACLLPTTDAAAGPPVSVMGLNFPNRVGLAAGLDKNGEAIDGLAKLGFGHIEIGTVTPQPQPGNPKPRLFRLPAQQALINRMGFNNRGVAVLLENVKSAKFKGILGINIGKNAATPMACAAEDYVLCLEKVYPFASYVTVNISSPNTRDLRKLQGEDQLEALLSTLKGRQVALADRHGRYVPLTLKLAPDLDPAQIQGIADALRRRRFDAVIATNTTVSRPGIAGEPDAAQAGGLSGAPLFELSTAVVAALAKALAGELPIIAAGGITDGKRAAAKLAAGAELVQIYSGLIYRGPELVGECLRATRDDSR